MMKTKYLIISVLLFFALILSVKGQESWLIDPNKIDSLYQLIEHEDKNDEEKIRLMNEVARFHFFNYEFQKAFEITKEARDLSRKLDFKGGEIMYNLTLTTFLQVGPEMEYYRQKALKLSLEKNNQYAEYYKELNFPIGYSRNMNVNWETVLDAMIPLYQLYKIENDKELQVVIGTIMGYCYVRLSRFNELRETIEQKVELHRELNQLFLEMISFSYLHGFILRDENQEESQRMIEKMISNMSKFDNKSEIAFLNRALGDTYRNDGKYSIALEHYLKSEGIFESIGDIHEHSEVLREMGFLYETMELYGKATNTWEKYIANFKKINNSIGLSRAYDRIILSLYYMEDYANARKYMALALESANSDDEFYFEARSNMLEGLILHDKEKYKEALTYLHQTYESYLLIAKRHRNGVARFDNPFILMFISQGYFKLGDFQNSLKYALICLETEKALYHPRTIIREKITFLISEIYIGLGQTQNAFDYIKMHQEVISQAKETENANKVAEDIIRSVIEKSEIEKEILEKERTQKIQESRVQRVWIFSISGAFISAIILVLVLYRNNKNKQKANVILKEQKNKIEQTLEKLKTTQSQLIQSEKMASLGELTAGIAHEIQNPLNFVNNFSEVSEELLDELKEEIKNGSKEEIEEILKNLNQNLGKINHHGQRASGIVKGMLDHSRASSGERVLTDINVLAEEYLRLSYHGLRAKDKSFTADFKTNLDASIPKIAIVPQDIGRVILNLINNAFYAVSERRKENDENYKPEVIVKTQKMKDHIEISVKDNGNGIPQELLDKIFQPFFTTKPTGQGTGLGLSLSYDIVKAHGGELEVDSEENSGTEFKITLPIEL